MGTMWEQCGNNVGTMWEQCGNNVGGSEVTNMMDRRKLGAVHPRDQVEGRQSEDTGGWV